MSAFIVDEAHINALVTVMVQGPKGRRGHVDVSWMVPNAPRTTWRTVDSFPHDGGESPMDKIGQMLWAENVKSVNARYNESDEPESFHWRPMTGRRLTAIEAIKAIHCYQYQSCEHDGWETSEAKAITDALEAELVRVLPGYDEAEWSISA